MLPAPFKRQTQPVRLVQCHVSNIVKVQITLSGIAINFINEIDRIELNSSIQCESLVLINKLLLKVNMIEIL